MKFDQKEIKRFFLRNGYLLVSVAWLITLSFLVNNYWWYISSPSNVQQLLEKNIQRREARFQKVASDTTLMYELLNRDYNENDLKKYTSENEDFYLFFFKGDWETFWTSNQISFDSTVSQLNPGTYFKKLRSGYYEIIRKDLDKSNYVLCFIPVKEQYYFSNPYLPDQFYQLPRISNQYKITSEGDGLPIRSVSGKTLFHVQYTSASVQNHSPWISGLLLALAIVCIMVFLNQFALFISKNTSQWWGFLFLCVIFIFVRILSYLGIITFDFQNYELFDSTIYASSLVLKSLGDLLINIILVSWIILYAYNRLRSNIYIPKRLPVWMRYILLFLVSFTTFYLTFFATDLISGLVIDSKISFDVTDFFSLNIYSFVGFIILGLLGFCFFFLSPVINRVLMQLSSWRILKKYIFLVVAGSIWLAIQFYVGTDSDTFWVMIWVMAYFCLLDLTGIQMERNISLERFILWLLILTLSITAIIVYYNKQREFGYRKQLAIKLTKQKDPTLLLNLGMIDTVLVKDPLVVSYFQTHNTSKKEVLREHLLNNYFPNLQNKYDLTFYTFDRLGKQIGAPDQNNIAKVSAALTNEVIPTEFKNLFFKQVNLLNYNYIATLQVFDPHTDSLKGFLYYEMSPKTIKPQSLYPELLMQTEDYQFKNAVNKYSYAVYDHLRLSYHRNSYPFPLKMKLKDVPDIDFNQANKGDNSILRYKVSDNKVVVMVREERNWLEAMTLFAYLFGIFLLLVLFFKVFQIIVRSRLQLHAFRELTRLNIRNKVHTIIIFIVIFVFVILGISTIQFFINRYDVQHKNNLEHEISSLLVRVQMVIKSSSSRDSLASFYGLEYDSKLSKNIQNLANMDGDDINIYDLDGNLRISTQNLIYKNGLLSHKMNPLAYYKLYFLNQVQVTQKERVGNLDFLSSYVSIRDENGKLLAFLNQPYYASQSDLKLEISNFLVTLINLNAFIFLLAGVLALLFTYSITHSFNLIIDKLRNVNLNGKNEEIEWEYDDEIRSLVEEYNKMVRKLEDSAARLARSEREGAWREMARQIAHEIKNPLTPMKLSLQHLQLAIRNDSPRKDKLTNSVVQTMIEQIDHLSQIASDFSDFANITYGHKEKIVLNDILSSVISLHHGYGNIEFDYEAPEEIYRIIADKTQINRVFTNLIQNAMQAIPDEENGIIRIKVEREGDLIIIQINDNGSGIENEVRDQIFTPNFTTKTSGTGLGLAICKNIILQSDGEIWFDSEVNKGTTFYVRLPPV